MKKSKQWFLSKLPVGATALILWPVALFAISANGGNFQLTKSLIGASGVNQATSANYSMAYGAGEDAAGAESQGNGYDLVSGYFSGYASGAVGNFSLLSTSVGTSKILQDGFQIGVPLNASVQLTFSNQLDPTTVANGIQVIMLTDHLGQSQNTVVSSTFTYNVIGTTVVISPQAAWPGNSLLDVVVTSTLQSIDGFSLAVPAHTQFVTVLDPAQENVVLHPLPVPGSSGAPSSTGAPSLSLDIPVQSLPDFAYILVSPDPLHLPLQVNPQTIQTATQKAQSSGGAYQTPLALQEIAAFNLQGQPLSLTKSITFSLSFNGGLGTVNSVGAPVRYDTLSLWSLDSVHQLWVKMPDSHPSGPGAIGSVTQFSVYALMGGADGNASSTYVFPNPWRPHGPNAGEGSGQTGTDSGGLTFSNLPSECTIKIYTISGERVRTLTHSDLAGPVGQQVWDGNTGGGEHAASGVYLWRVESATDGKNGKLIVIR